MRALKFITSHVIYNPAYTYKFQLKTTCKANLVPYLSQKPFCTLVQDCGLGLCWIDSKC